MTNVDYNSDYELIIDILYQTLIYELWGIFWKHSGEKKYSSIRRFHCISLQNEA